MDPKAQGALSGAATGAATGAAFGPWGAAIGGVAGGALGYINAKNRPKYQVNPLTDDNRALAMLSAFGTNGAVAQGQQQADQDQSQDVNNAQQVSSNTGTLLNAMRATNTNRKNAYQQLAGENAQLQQGGRQMLMGANKDTIDEQDKAWNYNVNQPYQLKIQQLGNGMKTGPENYYRMLDAQRAYDMANGTTGGANSWTQPNNFVGDISTSNIGEGNA